MLLPAPPAGSAQFNRFLRRHLNRLHMHLNSQGWEGRLPLLPPAVLSLHVYAGLLLLAKRAELLESGPTLLLPCRLYRILDGRVVRVPEGAPPLDKHGHGCWPPGWGPCSAASGGGQGDEAPGAGAGAGGAAAAAAGPGGGRPGGAVGGGGTSSGSDSGSGSSRGSRAVRSQRDLFELLGLPYREPYQRDCP